MILDFNPFTGEMVTFDYNDATDEITIGHHQDCTPIIDANKRAQIETDAKAQMKNDWIHYASVPNVLIMKWKQEHGVDFFKREDWPRVMALINSREYRDGVKATTITHDR